MKVNAKDVEKALREAVAERIAYLKLMGVPAAFGRKEKCQFR